MSVELSSDPNVAGSSEAAAACDGKVISSPLNPNVGAINITFDGSELRIDFPDYYGYGYVGVPYQSEFETMDLETSGERTLTDAKKLITSAGVGMLNTRGGFIGLPDKSFDDMEEIVFRTDEDVNHGPENFNGHKVVNFPSEWNVPGRVNIKNVDPVPMTILSVYPNGIAGD